MTVRAQSHAITVALPPPAEAGNSTVGYPNAQLSIVTNGSLFDDEKLAWVEKLDIGIGLSHDGPAQQFRGPDPLDDPASLAQIKRWVTRRMPLNRMSFNTVLHKHNLSLKAVRSYFSERLDLPLQAIELATEEVMLPYDQGGISLSLMGLDRVRYLHQVFWELATGSGMAVGTMRDKVDEFMRAQAQSRPLAALGQKCGMDRDDSIAVDMKGNVITCTNGTPSMSFGNLSRAISSDAAETETMSLVCAFKWPWSSRGLYRRNWVNVGRTQPCLASTMQWNSLP